MGHAPRVPDLILNSDSHSRLRPKRSHPCWAPTCGVSLDPRDDSGCTVAVTGPSDRAALSLPHVLSLLKKTLLNSFQHCE